MKMPDQNQASISSHSNLSETDGTTHDQADVEKQSIPETSPAAQLFPETDLSRGIVGWASQHDPENPQMFAASKKWALLGLISAFTLISPLASSMVSPAVVFMAKEFGETNETILSFSVSIYLIGYVVCLPSLPRRHMSSA